MSRQYYVFIIALIVKLFFMFLSLGSAQELSPAAQAVQDLFSGSNCQSVCFLGITPRVTTRHDLINWLNSQQIEYYELNPLHPEPIIEWRPSPQQFLNENLPITVTFVDGLVEQILGSLNDPVDAVIEVFGAPPLITADDSARPSIFNQVYLVYQDFGLAFKVGNFPYDGSTSFFSLSWVGNEYTWSEDPLGQPVQPCPTYGTPPCIAPTATPTSAGSTATPIFTPTPTPTLTPTSTPTTLITNITATNGKAYARDTVAVGTTIYIDRIYSFVSFPSTFAGQDFIRTANDDKQITTANFLTFDLTADAWVYVLYDSRFSPPAWLATWLPTGETVVTTEINNTQLARNVYRKRYAAGTVTLPGNSGANNYVMYNVVAIPDPVNETSLYRVNAGGGQVVSGNLTWTADGYVTGGRGNTLASGGFDRALGRVDKAFRIAQQKIAEEKENQTQAKLNDLGY